MMFSVPLIFGFGLGNALMLTWLAAAAAPIVIHLWNRRKYREVSWAAMEYLLAALRKNSRRIQIEQWLLLALRTLLIVLIVLAVAEPYMQQSGPGFVAGERTLKVLVIDGSYSMGYKPTDKNLFDRARQLASQIVEESNAGDGFTLVLMASPPSVIVGTPAMEPRDFVKEIENLKLPHGGGDLPATLIKVEQILRGAENSGLTRKEVYFLTDLGRTSWVTDLTPAQAAEHQQRIARLGEIASLVVVDLGQESSENLAVTNLSANDKLAIVARDVTFTAQVRNFGTQPVNHRLIELLVDGRRSGEAYVNIAPGEQVSRAFKYRFESAGDHVVEARLERDQLDIDNHRWLSLRVKESLAVLCVNGKPASTGLSGATDFVALALNPEEANSANRSLIVPEVLPESSLLERDLSRYDCIFLCNVGQFNRSEARVLASYVNNGGGLVFFLGDQVLADRYNRELGPQGLHVLPAVLNNVTAESLSPYRFDVLGYRHPLVSAFKGNEAAGLLDTPVYRYFRLAVPPNSKAKVALAFEGGDPAIVEEPIGRGRTILVATEGSLSSVNLASKNPWTAMPTWPSFVPLVQEMVNLAVGSQAVGRNLEVGQAIGDAVPSSALRSPLALDTPDGRHEEIRLSVNSEESRWSWSDTNFSGVYRAKFGQPSSTTEIFAVNVNTAESNLAKLSADELPKQFTTNKRSNLDEIDTSGVGRRSGLHKNLLYGVLGLLLLETLVAWRFGYSKT